jgi:hypothetical protein
MRPSWPKLIKEECNPVYELPRGRHETIQRQADKVHAGP